MSVDLKRTASGKHSVAIQCFFEQSRGHAELPVTQPVPTCQGVDGQRINARRDIGGVNQKSVVCRRCAHNRKRASFKPERTIAGRVILPGQIPKRLCPEAGYCVWYVAGHHRVCAQIMHGDPAHALARADISPIIFNAQNFDVHVRRIERPNNIRCCYGTGPYIQHVV